MNREHLIELYRRMAELTKPKCNCCRRAKNVPERRCCDPMYCQMAIDIARDRWDLTLEPTGNAIPLLGPEGCIAPPHVRPLCTVHTCDVESFGGDPNDPEWNKAYFALRNEIDDLEWLRLECEP